MDLTAKRFVVRSVGRPEYLADLWLVEDLQNVTNHRVVCDCELDTDAQLIADLLNSADERRAR